MNSELFSKEDIRKAAKVLRAVNHSLRQRILQLIESDAQLTVTEIYNKLHVEQSVCSQHLGILRKEGIIAVKPAGKTRHYYIVETRLEKINSFSRALAL